MKKRIICLILTMVMVVCIMPSVSAKTTPAGETVGNVLFYITNDKGEEILVSQIPVSEMEADMKAGKIDETLHNYSILDRFVTTVHQEGQGFSVQEFVDYARAKSPITNLRSLPMSFTGASTIRFWEIDQTGYDDMDTYTYADLYEVPRYNFPLLYEYWDYAKQDYYDPAGKMTRAQVIDKIFENGEPETVILTVRAFSQRFMITDEKYGTDYNMESYWQSKGLLDNERTIRIMKPMSKEELYNAAPTASDTRYWVANILLDTKPAPNVASLGSVAAPTAVMYDYGDNYYVHLSCATDGATILYNHNFISPSYTPTSPYGGTSVIVPKDSFKSGTVKLTARAVKEGYTDAGVVTLSLTSSGTEKNPETNSATYSDVPESQWYYDAVQYVMDKGLFDLTGKDTFSPGAPMTRAMLATALYRLEGSPSVTTFADFSDVTKGTPLSAAVSWCNAAKIVLGYEDNTFRADQNITREQIATMIFRYATYKLGVRSEELGVGGNGLSVFSDNDKISGYAREAMNWAVSSGVINGMGDGTVAPQGTATRAQVAQILYNYRD